MSQKHRDQRNERHASEAKSQIRLQQAKEHLCEAPRIQPAFERYSWKRNFYAMLTSHLENDFAICTTYLRADCSANLSPGDPFHLRIVDQRLNT